ncbi:MAG: hypothetical protein ACODAU_07040 [Myxococcota bacterium]
MEVPRPVWVLVLCAALGCGGEGAPPLEPAHYLRAGVDPDAEARAIEASFVRQGARRVGRVRGAGFHALSFEWPDGRTAVRVATRRGTAVALDAPAPGGPVRVALAERVPSGQDLDGDGRPEIAVRVVDERGSCLGLVRVLDGGLVREVAFDVGEALPGSCVEDLRDVGGGPGPEAIAVERLAPRLAGAPARVALPLAARSGRWAPAVGPAYDSFWEGARARRRRASARRPTERLRLALELAALERLRGGDRAAQVRAFDAALRGRVLSEAMAEVADCVRSHVADGWAQPVPTCYTPGSDGP